MNADTTRDINIPPIALSNVSGTLSGLNQLPANKGVYVQMAAGNPPLFSEALVGADGYYQLKVPNGTYTASLYMRLTSSQQSDLEFFNIASVSNGPAYLEGPLQLQGLSAGLRPERRRQGNALRYWR